ncbi:MAG: pyridoxine 5'-phosphate synthase [Candidatus Hydrogenedentes bacterium]|nr:pyridoxine 5'-phosphate synthase [Candidatus Hydrogenedentota bacterium]
MIDLGVNIDHVATLREARKGHAPDLLTAAKICELAGAQQITVHLRQDRRHIQDHDVELLSQALTVRLNLEMAAVDEIIAIAHRIRPHTVCLVPENRSEITTEGGLDVAGQRAHLKKVVAGFNEAGVKVSMFIDPELRQVDASAAVGADYVELHTGAYANAKQEDVVNELNRLVDAATHAIGCGLIFNAGHGLTVRNLRPVASIPGLNEVNIGHDIIARAVFIGLENAVKEILAVLQSCSP